MRIARMRSGNSALFTIVFFLTTMVLTAFVIIPKTNALLESAQNKNNNAKLALEAKLFTRYIDNQKSILQDLARFPSIVNAAMLSDGRDPILTDIFDNVVLGGKMGRVVLQDIAGTVVIQSPVIFRGNYSEVSEWVEPVISGSVPYHFQLIEQTDKDFSFKLSIPILYKTEVEGVLSAEITAPLNEVFFITQNENVAIRLQQGKVSVQTSSRAIVLANESTLKLEAPNLVFTYITDDAALRDKQFSLRNTVLFVLLVGLGVSFLLFVLVEYRSFRSKPGNDRRAINFSAHTIPIVVAIVGIAASVTAFMILRNIQQASFENELLAEGKSHIQQIRQSIERNLDVLDSTKAYIDASEYIDRAEFRTFVTQITTNHPSIQALEWAPYIDLENRSGFEKRARREGSAEFAIHELSENGEQVLAKRREFYFPVHYIEPMDDHDNTIGLDLLSDKERLPKLMKAVKGTRVATAPLAQVVDNELQSIMRVIQPIYNQEISQERRGTGRLDEIKGFSMLVLRVDELLESALRNNSNIVSINIQNINDPGNTLAVTNKGISTAAEEIDNSNRYSHSETLHIADQVWRVKTAISKSASTMWWLAWWILLGGILFSAMVTTWLVQLIHKRELLDALARKLNTLTLIAENSNDLILTTDIDKLRSPGGCGTISYTNESFARITGYTQDEVRGVSPTFLFGEETDENQVEKLVLAMQGEESYRADLELYSKNNDSFWVDVNFTPLKNDAGETIQYAAIMRDIRERKDAETVREMRYLHEEQQKQKLYEQEQAHSRELQALVSELERSNRELNNFAYVASHDLKEPLRGVAINADLLSREEVSEAGKQRINRMVELTTRMEQQISDLLFFSRLGRGDQSQEDIDPSDVIKSIEQELLEMLDLTCGTILIETELPLIHADKTKIKIIFQNLITNALKYNNAANKLISIGFQKSIKVNGEHLQNVFYVQDNGIGIDKRNHAKVFKIFTRLNREKDYGQGTGAGLSFVGKIIEEYGSKPTIASQLGQGATFYFSLPLAEHNQSENLETKRQNAA